MQAKLAYLRTFGCRANVSDGEKIAGMLAEAGYGFTTEQERADLILFNTCAIRENAENRANGNVGSLIHLKRKNPNLIVAVCGCMVQQENAAKNLAKTFPYVNLIFGTHVIHKLPELLRQAEAGKRVFDISDTECIVEDLPTLRESREDKSRADVPIMHGCDNFCAYCIVPYVRGRERSRKPEDVLREVRGLVADGYKEIMLLGQNVNSYQPSFPELLQEIDRIPGDYLLTFMTSHPKDFSAELIDTIAGGTHLSHNLHLPVQSGSNRVLELMNRGYTIEQYLGIVEQLRAKIPDVTLTTDIIVGFPGETREDFEETLALIRRARFNAAYTFIFSKREGTKAAEMPDPTDSATKAKWFAEMLAVLENTKKKD
jgi:tRNA-2-methylthio-N6-dimethylallyladenosine synthase